MSETIIGYINSIPRNELIVLESDVQQETPFGFKFTDELKLYNYPESQLQRSDIVQFLISDSNESNTATILLEEEDYDPDDVSESDFQKKFPSMLKERVFEITKIIKYLVHKDCVRELGFSISFCDEIEQIKHASIESFENIVVADCINSCPPNTLYLIDK
jgi:hypothetical protein